MIAMNIEKIKEIFKNKEREALDIEIYHAVLLPLIEIDGELHLIYEVRAKHMNSQPGEISFPGGRVEVEENFREAAVRETFEEIGIKKENIEIIGELDFLTRTGNFMLYPYIGEISNTKMEDLVLNPDEVDEVFTVPLSFLCKNQPEIHEIKYEPNFKENFPFHKIQNGKKYNWHNMKYPVYFFEYQGHIIWGLTAKITNNFVEYIKKNM
ncbi:MAG TPA: CoA pyrophosphatase [Clostridiales bacterium]|jgi:8-oxo-dGTP pyrophosphatase MutT (NUDIX family)|nr:CoA pyrophosphatase [Clostridiales bacterium]